MEVKVVQGLNRSHYLAIVMIHDQHDNIRPFLDHNVFVCQEAHPLATIFDNAQLNAVALSQKLSKLRRGVLRKEQCPM